MLEAAQGELQERYSALAAARKPLDHPVYAIEHGFDEQRIDQLRKAASLELRQCGLRPQRWLVWMALAAEAGYRYEGDEYWPELEFAAGEWRNQTNRSIIRAKFEKFRAAFGGPEPVGAWAQHFNIISWPIANAVLPKYLQPHFAEHLFHQRFALIDAIPRGAASVGTLLLNQYRGYSARFAIFLKQVELTGQIVLALRDQDVSGEQSRIAPDVLSRIIRDVGRKSLSKQQLQSARRVFSTKQASVSASLRPATAAVGTPGETPPLRPARLAARLEGSTARIGLIFPDIGEALKQAGLSNDLLSNLRIRMPGDDSAWEPGATLLTYANRDRVLDTLPETGASLIGLECSNAQLKAALQPFFESFCRATHLLKIEGDGLYRERVTRQVRSGSSYLLVRREPLPPATLINIGAVQCRSLTSEAHVYALDLGSQMTPGQRVALESIAIGSIVGIEVEPVGLMPRPDDDGFPTWLSSEPILLTFTADYACDGFQLVLDTEPAERLNADHCHAYSAIEGLSPGIHRLTIQAIENLGGTASGPIASFDFAVREPEPWPIGMRGKSGFRVMVDPPKAKLEAILNHAASVSLIGPADRSGHWSLETFDAAGRRQARFDGGNLKVGASQQDIFNLIDRLRKSASDAIDSAHRVDFIVAMSELGSQAISFQNDVLPIRWIYDPGTKRARLIDETDESEGLGLFSFAFSTPLIGREIEREDALNGLLIEPPGALLVAKRAETPAYMFVNVPRNLRLHGFGDLKSEQSFTIGELPPKAVLKLLRAHARWSRARAVGPQATLQKVMTVDEICKTIAKEACGPEFAALLRSPNLERAQRLVGGSPGFGYLMRTFEPRASRSMELERFSELALRYQAAPNAADCKDPFCLAFYPRTFRQLSGPEAINRMERALSNRTLVLGAFLAKAASERCSVVGGTE